ncbi:hypothetical protein KVH17_34095 [Streptomyces olivaceus]|uniref:hypothetical protein n=1 Tax=Streptomyces olivaceus TaxID=47716 RepID=UPI001CCB845F|nr:hypothetical protein [Streptomyces olivaceus]MBZ6204703.1 hypothetical protein [Streptomyces olivaceus]MBZ6288891.1 hypothetical protein [Streptomyces olivaceus]
MTGQRRTRIERVRAAAGIAALALQQIEDDLSADDVDQEELAAILRELIEDTDPPGGFIAAVAQLLTAAARRAEQIEPDRDGDASCPLDEAAALLTDDAGQRLIWAARALHPQGAS